MPQPSDPATDAHIDSQNPYADALRSDEAPRSRSSRRAILIVIAAACAVIMLFGFISYTLAVRAERAAVRARAAEEQARRALAEAQEKLEAQKISDE